MTEGLSVKGYGGPEVDTDVETLPF